MPTTPLPKLTIGEVLRIAKDITDRDDLHITTITAGLRDISAQVDHCMSAATLRVAHGMLNNPTVEVTDYTTHLAVHVSGTYRGVPVLIYRGFWDREDRELFTAYLESGPVDARLLDVLAGDTPVGA